MSSSADLPMKLPYSSLVVLLFGMAFSCAAEVSMPDFPARVVANDVEMSGKDAFNVLRVSLSNSTVLCSFRGRSCASPDNLRQLLAERKKDGKLDAILMFSDFPWSGIPLPEALQLQLVQLQIVIFESGVLQVREFNPENRTYSVSRAPFEHDIAYLKQLELMLNDALPEQ